MNVKFSNDAKQAIEEKIAGNPDRKLRLAYDTEALGCSFDGIPTFWLVDKLSDRDEKVNTNADHLFVDKEEKGYFEEEMVVEWEKDHQTFLLKSPNQILQSHMHVDVKNV